MELLPKLRTGSLENLEIHFNSNGWGPISGEKVATFAGVPYAHFDKKEKIGRPADLGIPNQQSNQRQYQKRRGDDAHATTHFSYRHDATEDNTFQLVDTAKTVSRHKYSSVKRNQLNRNQQQQNRTTKQFGLDSRGGALGGKRGNQPLDLAQIAKNKMAIMRAKYGNKGQGGAGGRRQDRKQDRIPSLAVGGDWILLEEFDLQQLLKLLANNPTVEDLDWCGHIDQYDDSFEKLSTRTARPLKRYENKLFYDVPSREDPVLEKLAVDALGEVYATDSVLAQLMASPRTVYSWDIIVEKVNGIIFLDKRDESNFDLLTVSETAVDPPTASDDIEEYNHPEKLSIEATMINQNFSQQIVTDLDNGRKKFKPNPFFDDSQVSFEPASVVYRYRRFHLGPNIRLIARCELHGWTLKRDQELFITSYALNEWDSRYAGGVNWRQKIDQQRGAVLATELKNNSAKIAKWTAQSLLAGADQMKIGYVSRVAPTEPDEHTILATQFFKPKDLASQINLNLLNIWGIIKMICELLLKQQDGKFVLLKDPNKPIIRLYSTPLTAFEEDEEEEDDEDGDEEDEDEEADEDGEGLGGEVVEENVVPSTTLAK